MFHDFMALFGGTRRALYIVKCTRIARSINNFDSWRVGLPLREIETLSRIREKGSFILFLLTLMLINCSDSV